MKKFEMPEVQVITFEEDIMAVTLSAGAIYNNGFDATTTSDNPSGIF